DQLARGVSGLVELQNAIAKLMMSARQHDEQLLYLQRRLAEVETQARGRGSAALVAPSLPATAGMPSPLPPPPVSAVPSAPASPLPPARVAAPPPVSRATPPPAAPAASVSAAEELYRSGLAKYQAGDLDG